MTTLYVSTQGRDEWSGTLPDPNPLKTDGPLATLTGARNRIRHLTQPPAYDRGGWQPAGFAGPVTVQLRGGIYPVRDTLVFGPEDSGPVTYAAYPRETPILDGGERITGWQADRVNGRNCWGVDLPEVKRGEWYFRSLFVNGKRCSRPRLPKADWFRIEDVPDRGLKSAFHEGCHRFKCRKGDIGNWRNLTDVEVVVMHYWNDEHMPIASFDESSGLVTCTRRSIFNLNEDFRAAYAKYYVSNVFEALSEPGEWYLDRAAGRLYYLPRRGERMETAEVYAPRVTQILKLAGAPDQGRRVQALRFEGLTIRHTEAELPPGGWDANANNPAEGMRAWPKDVDYASAPQAAFNVPGTIVLEGAHGCAIEDCTIEHIGWYGVEVGDGCTGNRIVGNTLADIGAGGVTLNGSDSTGPRARLTGNNVVTDNHIHHGGRVFHQAIGILCRHSFGNVIAHNHIHDLFYTGISCGWVWGFMETVCRDNRIENNHIHHLGFGWLSDMGGIYMLGVQPGTVIRGNVIHDVERANYGGWGIYLDEGSSHILVENNLVYDTSSEGYNQHYGRENIVRNNIFAAGREGCVSLGRSVEGVRAFTFMHNIVVGEGVPLFHGGYACQLDRPGFWADYNLLWSTKGQPWQEGRVGPAVQKVAMAAWKAAGLDRHSRVADPRFRDYKSRDFTLPKDSPAAALGFVPFDTSVAGIRPKRKR